jgi:hypothetical protein
MLLNVSQQRSPLLARSSRWPRRLPPTWSSYSPCRYHRRRWQSRKNRRSSRRCSPSRLQLTDPRFEAGRVDGNRSHGRGGLDNRVRLLHGPHRNGGSNARDGFGRSHTLIPSCFLLGTLPACPCPSNVDRNPRLRITWPLAPRRWSDTSPCQSSPPSSRWPSGAQTRSQRPRGWCLPNRSPT